MKHNTKVLFVSSVLMLASSMANAETCCIAGAYTGTAVDDETSCQTGETRHFTMVINQRKCQQKITGQVATDSSGETSTLEGGVLVTGDSCAIKGTITKSSTPALSGPRIPATSTPRSAETTEFRGMLNRRSASKPWVLKDGAYISSDGCKGHFSMAQQQQGTLR